MEFTVRLLVAVILVLVMAPLEPLANPRPGIKGRGFRGRKTSLGMSRAQKTIIGGRKTTAEEFPYMAYIRIFFEGDPFPEFCGGAIIGARHILSAAHCLKKKHISRVCVILGNENRKYSRSHRFSVLHSTFYPKRKNEYVDADIAILMVDRPIPIGSKTIRPITLMNYMDLLHVNTTCTVAGWGKTYNPGADPDVLRQVKVPLVPKERCRSAYPNLKKDTLCAGDMTSGGRDACKGDSGGPLVCRAMLTGIVKEGKGCGKPGFPGIYTDARYYWRWVTHVMERDLKRNKGYKGRGRHPQC